jgi:hypothetical protein
VNQWLPFLRHRTEEENCESSVGGKVFSSFLDGRGNLTVVDSSLEKYFFADALRREYWLQKRKDTFRKGLKTVRKRERRLRDACP